MTQRTLFTLLTLTAALTLAACGDDSTKPAPAPTGTPGAPPGNPAFNDAMRANAQKLLDDATQYIKDNKLDLAQKSVDQLETMKPQMTPDWQSRVDQLKSALDTAKKAGGMKIPGM